MNILILGGTAWLGRTVAELALAHGHRVTCVARGASGAVPGGARLVVADRDAANAFAELGGACFDAVIDVSRQPGQVRRAVAALEPLVDRYVFVSTASVYAASELPNQDESAVRLPALQADEMTSMAEYGQAKVACEDAVLAGFGHARSVIARAGLIGGPGDVSDRSGYWPLRFATSKNAGEPVLLPESTGLFTQLIDVRDLAAWLLHAASGVAGVYNLLGPSTQLGTFFQTASTVANFHGKTVNASAGWLQANGVEPWAGPKSMPLWIPMASHAGFGKRSIQAALTNGLVMRPLAQTLADTLAWELEREQPSPRKAGISNADHRELLALYAARANIGQTL